MDDHRRELRERFIDARGYWNDFWTGLLELDPEFFEAYLQFSSVPFKHGALSPKFREFVYIAIDASTTHLYEPGLRQHIRNALEHGANTAEIVEVYELVSGLGIHTLALGLPVLLEELAGDRAPVYADREPRIAEVAGLHGWDPALEELLDLDPNYLSAYLDLAEVPWRNGPLSARQKELILIAADAATTHLYSPGLRQHIRKALDAGASREEIMEVYELTSVLGIHTCTLGVPVLLDEISKLQS